MKGLSGSLRGLLGHALELLQVRLELFATELEEERARLLRLLAYGAAAFVLLAAGILFLAVFLTVLLWEDHRLLTLGIFTALFLLGGVIALLFARHAARSRSRLLSASLNELTEDRTQLESGV